MLAFVEKDLSCEIKLFVVSDEINIITLYLPSILTLFYGDRNVPQMQLSDKDQEEKARRSAFVRGLVLSTFFDDFL